MCGLNDRWLVGTSSGVYSPDDEGQWKRLGAYPFRITAFYRSPERVLAATGSGLWQIRQGPWLQLHDETLTEVMDVVDGGQEVIAASAYGVALGKTDTLGQTRWRWLSDDLPVNQRFTNALALADEQIIAGSEGGVLVYGADGGWRQTTLRDVAVRSLTAVARGFYAGSDGGLWFSGDGVSWQSVSEPIPVYSFAECGAVHIVGTEQGVRLVNGEGAWQSAGLESTRISAVAIDSANARHWLAGACPGGLWETWDAGESWTGITEIQHTVEAIASPGGALS
jgi:hypothetical protein